MTTNSKKSIKTKVNLTIVSIILMLSIIIGTIASYLNYKVVMDTLETSMIETAKVSANQMSDFLTSYKNVVSEVGTMPILSNPNVSIEEKKAVIEAKAADYGFLRGNIIKPNGIGVFNGEDYSNSEHFRVSINGSSFCSNPEIGATSGELRYVISAPIWQDGVKGSSIYGVISFVPDYNFLNNKVSEIKVGPKDTVP